MSETRSPDAMPTEWRIREFAHERGFGVLCHASGEEAIFNIDAWDLGQWKPSRKDVATSGPGSPLLPQPGESVRVQWKRSASGRNVPKVVQPTGRAPSTRKEFTLAQWIKGVQERSQKLVGVTASALLKVLAGLDEDRAQEWRDGEPRDAQEFAFLLMDLGHLVQTNPAWSRTHAGWIYTDDHRWDRRRAGEHVPAILGLRSPPEPVSDGDESLSEYVARCNTAAASEGTDLRLEELTLDGDAHVFVAMTRPAFAALVAGGYLDANGASSDPSP